MPRDPKVRSPLRRGQLVFHGTAIVEDFDHLHGPAWLSDSRKVAEFFTTWHGSEGRPRIITYELVARPKLYIVESHADMIALNMRFESFDTYGLAEAICDSGEADGWHLPHNYPEGSDTMLCEPERFLKLVRVEELDRYDLRQAGDRKENPSRRPNPDYSAGPRLEAALKHDGWHQLEELDFTHPDGGPAERMWDDIKITLRDDDPTPEERRSLVADAAEFMREFWEDYMPEGLDTATEIILLEQDDDMIGYHTTIWYR